MTDSQYDNTNGRIDGRTDGRTYGSREATT